MCVPLCLSVCLPERPPCSSCRFRFNRRFDNLAYRAYQLIRCIDRRSRRVSSTMNYSLLLYVFLHILDRADLCELFHPEGPAKTSIACLWREKRSVRPCACPRIIYITLACLIVCVSAAVSGESSALTLSTCLSLPNPLVSLE